MNPLSLVGMKRQGVLSMIPILVWLSSEIEIARGCNVALAALGGFWPKGTSEIRIRWDDEGKQRLEERRQRARDELGTLQLGYSPRLGVDNKMETPEHHLPHASSNCFIGRQRHVQEVEERLGPVGRIRANGKPKVLVLYGLGGSGKTSLALKFAEDSRDRYWGIFWVDSTSYETLETSFASLGLLAGKGASWPGAIHWLSQCSKPWLLIFDNADDPDMDLSKYVPSSGKGHIVVTTRNPEASVYATEGCIKLSGMDPEEAITLLLRSAYPEPDTKSRDPTKKKDAGAIAKRLGYLAIALTLAGATIRKNIYTLEAYLHHYLGHRRVIMKSPSPQMKEYADTIATWELPFQRISQKESTENRDAVDLVHMFAFLHFESIPEQIFRRSWHNLLVDASDPESYPAFVQSDRPFDEDARASFRSAIRVLYDYALIDHDPDRETCSLHPVVHRWAQERLSGAEQLRWLKCTMTILAYCISPLLEASGHQFRRSLLPHIGACLGGLRNRGVILPDTLSRAAECEKFALVYAENGRWDLAKRWQEDILKFRKKKLGWWHHDTIEAHKSLAETEWNLFHIKSAALRQKHIVMLRWLVRPSLGCWAAWPPWQVDYIDYCLSLDDLGRTLWLAGDRVWSRHVGERAVRGLTKRLGPDDPRTLTATFNLARTYLHLGDQQLSRRLLVTVLIKRKRLFGMDHPDTLMTRNELGMNLLAQKTQNELLRQRQLGIAEILVRNVLKARERIFGEEHAYTLWSVNDLSKVLCDRNRGAKAAAMLEDILDAVIRTLGNEHVGMTMTKSNLARAYVLSQRWQEAEMLLTELLVAIPPDHPDSIAARSGLVHVRIRMGKLFEAEADCGKLLSMMKERRFEKILTPDSPRALKIYEQMLEIYHLQNRTEELQALSLMVPAAKVPMSKAPFDMLPAQKILRTKSELDRLSSTI